MQASEETWTESVQMGDRKTPPKDQTANSKGIWQVEAGRTPKAVHLYLSDT